ETDRLAVCQSHVAREERRAVLRRIKVVRTAAADGERAPAEFECRPVLKKEVAGLRLEEIEPRGVDLEQVERTVREIRIERQRAGEFRRDLVESVAARTETERLVLGLLPIEAIAQRPISLDIQAEA